MSAIGHNQAALARGAPQVTLPAEMEIELFDILPPLLREVVAESAQAISPHAVHHTLQAALARGMPWDEAVVATAWQVRRTEAMEIAAFGGPAARAGVSVQRPEYGVVRPRRRGRRAAR